MFTLVLVKPFKEEWADRKYLGLQLEPIERGPRPVCLFFFENGEKDKGVHMGGCRNYGPFFGSLGDPKGDHNFDNHPYSDPSIPVVC